MLLMDLEEQIKPLSRPEKRKLFDFLALELNIELPPAVFQTMQSAPFGTLQKSGFPVWSQYEAYEAAKDLEEALKFDDLPIL